MLKAIKNPIKIHNKTAASPLLIQAAKQNNKSSKAQTNKTQTTNTDNTHNHLKTQTQDSPPTKIKKAPKTLTKNTPQINTSPKQANSPNHKYQIPEISTQISTNNTPKKTQAAKTSPTRTPSTLSHKNQTNYLSNTTKASPYRNNPDKK